MIIKIMIIVTNLMGEVTTRCGCLLNDICSNERNK
jgi:hypothetical protein